MLAERISQLQDRLDCIFQSKQKLDRVTVNLDNYTIVVPEYPQPTLYKPTTTALNFHKSNDRVRVVRGHVGSGKTTMMCAELVFRAVAMAPCNDGIRRSRWAIVRNTYGDLEKTTLTTWKTWFSNLGQMRWRQGTAFTIDHVFIAKVICNGIEEEREIRLSLLPIALDRVADVTKHLKSLEVTGVFLNELSELSRMVLDFFSGGRLPRYPALKDFPEGVQYWSGIFADTNPPEQDSWIYKMFEEQRPPQYTMFAQPPAVIKEGDDYVINPEAENIRNILNGSEEYVKMTWGKDEAFIRVYLMGEYGTISDQRRVYGGYNDNIHSEPSLRINRNLPLIMAADLGTVAPTILIGQIEGACLRLIKEFCGEFTTIREICNDAVLPWLHQTCQGMNVEAVIYDPADTYDGADQLREVFGPVVRPAITNSIRVRIDAVSDRLAKLSKGIVQLVIDRKECSQLRKGFNGKYYYRKVKVIGEERYTEEPHKTHPISDVHDALQYICLYVNSEYKPSDGFDYHEEYKYKQHRDKADNITGY